MRRAYRGDVKGLPRWKLSKQVTSYPLRFLIVGSKIMEAETDAASADAHVLVLVSPG